MVKMVSKQMLKKEMINAKTQIPTRLLQNLYLKNIAKYKGAMANVGFLLSNFEPGNKKSEEYVEQLIYWTFKNKPEALYEHIQTFITMALVNFIELSNEMTGISKSVSTDIKKYGHIPFYFNEHDFKQALETKLLEVKNVLVNDTNNFKEIILSHGKGKSLLPTDLKGKNLKELVMIYTLTMKNNDCIFPDGWGDANKEFDADQLKLLKEKLPEKVFMLISNIQKNNCIFDGLKKDTENIRAAQCRQFEQLLKTRIPIIENALANDINNFKKIILSNWTKKNMLANISPMHLNNINNMCLKELVITYTLMQNNTRISPGDWGCVKSEFDDDQLKFLKEKLPTKIFMLVSNIQKNSNMLKELREEKENMSLVFAKYVDMQKTFKRVQTQRSAMEKYVRLANKINTFCGQEMGITLKNLPTKIAAAACLNINEAIYNELGDEANRMMRRVPKLFSFASVNKHVVLKDREVQDMPFVVTPLVGDQIYDYVDSRPTKKEKNRNPYRLFCNFADYIAKKLDTFFADKHEPSPYMKKVPAPDTKTAKSKKVPLRPSFDKYVDFTIRDDLYLLETEEAKNLSNDDAVNPRVNGIVTKQPKNASDPTKVFHWKSALSKAAMAEKKFSELVSRASLLGEEVKPFFEQKDSSNRMIQNPEYAKKVEEFPSFADVSQAFVERGKWVDSFSGICTYTRTGSGQVGEEITDNSSSEFQPLYIAFQGDMRRDEAFATVLTQSGDAVYIDKRTGKISMLMEPTHSEFVNSSLGPRLKAKVRQIQQIGDLIMAAHPEIPETAFENIELLLPETNSYHFVLNHFKVGPNGEIKSRVKYDPIRTRQQRDNFSCGVWAIQNATDIIRTGQLQQTSLGNVSKQGEISKSLPNANKRQEKIADEAKPTAEPVAPTVKQNTAANSTIIDHEQTVPVLQNRNNLGCPQITRVAQNVNVSVMYKPVVCNIQWAYPQQSRTARTTRHAIVPKSDICSTVQTQASQSLPSLTNKQVQKDIDDGENQTS